MTPLIVPRHFYFFNSTDLLQISLRSVYNEVFSPHTFINQRFDSSSGNFMSMYVLLRTFLIVLFSKKAYFAPIPV